MSYVFGQFFITPVILRLYPLNGHRTNRLGYNLDCQRRKTPSTVSFLFGEIMGNKWLERVLLVLVIGLCLFYIVFVKEFGA